MFQVVLLSEVELSAADRYCLGWWIAAERRLYLGGHGLITASGAPVPLAALRVVSGTTPIEPAPADVRGLELFPF